MSIALAAALGLVIGFVIGALGGGGGVLAVPALVYALGQDAQSATTSSIIIVGIISVVGVLARLRDRTIDWRTGIAFGAVGIAAVWWPGGAIRWSRSSRFWAGWSPRPMSGPPTPLRREVAVHGSAGL